MNVKDYVGVHGLDQTDNSKQSKNEAIEYKKNRMRKQIEDFVVRYGQERIDKILTGSEQQWSDFLNMPHSEKIEFLLGSIKDKTFPEIMNNILIKNINDRKEHIHHIENNALKKYNHFFKGIDKYFELKNLKGEIKVLKKAQELITSFPSELSPDEMLSRLGKLKIPRSALMELNTALKVYSRHDLPIPDENKFHL